MSEQPADDRRLFLLDAFALIYRAYFSFIRTPRVNSKGFNTSAAFGFTTTLLDLIKREKPTHLAVVFDTAAPTERHEALLDYKANREEMPDDIRSNLPYIRRIIEALNIPILESDGYEADDVIGTLAKKAETEGYITYMVTPDKDFGQLVTDRIIMYKPGRGGDPPEKLGPKEICDRWGLERTDQVIDILGLMGDAVDNIPGIPGIGEKTAMKLVQQFGSLEGVLENVEQLKGKQKENVIQFAEQGRLSKLLATINIEAPVELDHDALHLDPPDKDKVMEVFSELEFRTLVARVLAPSDPGGADVAKPKEGRRPRPATAQVDLFGTALDADGHVVLEEFRDINTVPHRYFLADKNEDMYMLAAQLKKQPRFCFDTETTGTDERTAELVGLAFSWKAHEGHYVPVPADPAEAQRIVDIFKPVFENEAVGKVAQNAKFDLRILARYGVQVNGALFDTMVAHFLLKPDQQKHGMDYLSETYLRYRPVSITALIGEKGSFTLLFLFFLSGFNFGFHFVQLHFALFELSQEALNGVILGLTDGRFLSAHVFNRNVMFHHFFCFDYFASFVLLFRNVFSNFFGLNLRRTVTKKLLPFAGRTIFEFASKGIEGGKHFCGKTL